MIASRLFLCDAVLFCLFNQFFSSSLPFMIIISKIIISSSKQNSHRINNNRNMCFRNRKCSGLFVNFGENMYHHSAPCFVFFGWAGAMLMLEQCQKREQEHRNHNNNTDEFRNEIDSFYLWMFCMVKPFDIRRNEDSFYCHSLVYAFNQSSIIWCILQSNEWDVRTIFAQSILNAECV